ncbi:MAG: hypothetical protein AB7K09_02330 [Planctomycetota bacterium]
MPRTCRRHLVLLMPLLVAIGGCCNRPAIPTDDAFQQINTPEVSYALLKQSITLDQKNLFYYLLAKDVRNEYPYWMISQGWGQIQDRLGVDVRKSKLLKVEYLPDSPFPPRPAARMVVEYPHPEDGRVVESFLVLLEIERSPYGEVFPQWRVYYPYGPYQNNVTWFQRLQEQEQQDATTTGGGGGSGSTNEPPR